jgi:hypothetical protein
MATARDLIAVALAFAWGSPELHAQALGSGVRLDLPPNYFTSKPSPASKLVVPGKAHAASREDECGSDCVNFDAGYAWAERHEITGEDRCQGHPLHFVEGCLTYVAERAKHCHCAAAR